MCLHLHVCKEGMRIRKLVHRVENLNLINHNAIWTKINVAGLTNQQRHSWASTRALIFCSLCWSASMESQRMRATCGISEEHFSILTAHTCFNILSVDLQALATKHICRSKSRWIRPSKPWRNVGRAKVRLSKLLQPCHFKVRHWKKSNEGQRCKRRRDRTRDFACPPFKISNCRFAMRRLCYTPQLRVFHPWMLKPAICMWPQRRHHQLPTIFGWQLSRRRCTWCSASTTRWW